MARKATIGKRVSAAIAICALAALGSPAQTCTTLASFHHANGANPAATLVQATSGDLFGTTAGGGTNVLPNGTGGTVFKISPRVGISTLHSFCALANCADGALPAAPLVQATNGDLHGTTYEGGPTAGGTVFKITQSGTLTTVYGFCSLANCADGEEPVAGLVQATNGGLYGTTANGGAGVDCVVPYGCGTIFKITPSGALTTIYNFCSLADCADGQSPWAGLVQATNGDLYGTTYEGGAHGGGTVFRMTPSGTLTTLYSFCALANCADGANPEAGLVQATNGKLYGTTYYGGANCQANVPAGCGTVFEIIPSGTLTTLYSFCALANCADGANPEAGLAQANNGDLYGTTQAGAANGSGAIFQITPSDTLTTVSSFSFECGDGSTPSALVQATNGGLYGTMYYGGADGAGTIFSLSLGLGPFVESLPTAGKVGSPAKILGTNLTGATSVTFNGTATVFNVASPTLITTTVPTGATSGKIQVVTPSVTLSSDMPFRVLP